MGNPLRVTPHGDLEIVMTPVFDAPRSLVFDAWTKPELLRRWLGVHSGWTMPVCEVDLRVGGAYRYVWRGPEGMEMGVSGVFLEVVAPERIMTTEKFDQAWYPGRALITHVLTEHDDKTTCTINLRYDSTEARDAVLASPMEGGVGAGCMKLDELLASLAARGSRTVDRLPAVL